MDALKFFKEWNRMCSSSNECAKCPFNGKKCDLIRDIMEEHIAVVEQWSREHPRKTRQDVFLEMFPTAKMDNDGSVDVCPAEVDAKQRDPDGQDCGDLRTDGAVCRREGGLPEVE